MISIQELWIAVVLALYVVGLYIIEVFNERRRIRIADSNAPSAVSGDETPKH